MARPQITQETLTQMLRAMEAPDGQVTKERFRAPYMKLHPDTPTEAYDKLWSQIDENHDGNLDKFELAHFFGFDYNLLAKDMEDETKAMEEMSDDQILEALQMEQALRELQMQSKRDSSPKIEAKPTRVRMGSRDEDVKVFKLPTKITMDDPPPEVDLLQSCDAGDEASVLRLIESGVNVRIEDDKGEMPMHKVCRHGLKKCVRAILDASEKLKKGGKSKDMNVGDRNGKTPLMISAEYKQIDLFTYMLDSGASLLSETNHGWNILHVVVNTNHRDLLQTFFTHPSVAKYKKQLIDSVDKDLRGPMHIAAFKCDEEIVTILAQAGAKVTTEDQAGNSAMKLAERSGRRKSRDIMEGYAPDQGEAKTPVRRGSVLTS